MFIVIGILLIIAGIAFMIIRPFLRKEEVVVGENKWGKQTKPAAPAFLLWFTPARSLMILGVGLLFTLSSGLFFYAEPGVNYMLQYPWGGQKAITSPGVKVKAFGYVIPISNEIVFKYVLPDPNTGELPSNSKYAYVEEAQQWEFNDAIKGQIATSVIIRVNVKDDETFIEMVENNKSEINLVYSRIIPTINSAIRNSAKLMSAQEYLVGRSSDFDYYFRDQLENGLYRLHEIEVKENNSIIGDTSAIRTVGLEGSSQPNKRVYVITEDANGVPIRQLGKDGVTVFAQYNLSIADAIAEKVDWEDKFDDRLDTQKQLVADVQKEKQEAEKEYFRAKKEEQAGEANKIKKQKELELIQIEETVAAETRAKSAKYKEEEQMNLLAATKIEVDRIKRLADAEYYKNQKLVAAGLTPQERAYWNYRSDSVNAAYISKMGTPSIMSGGNSGNGGELQQLLQLQVLEQLKRQNTQK